MSSTPHEDLALLRKAATICWESMSPAVVQAQWQAVALRVAQLTVEHKIVGRLTEWIAADTVNWNEFLAGVEKKHAKLEDELRAAVELASSSVTADINRVRESMESCGKALEDLAKKNEETEKASSQGQSIVFEMVEAETQKCEEQNASVEKRLAQLATNHVELAATVEKRWTKYDTNSKEREEALLWFQEEILRELRLLKDQVLVEMNKYEHRLGELENGTQRDRFVQELQLLEEKIVEEIGKQNGRINAVGEDLKTLRDTFDGKITAIEDEQSETKRLWMDQYVRSTVQLHDIRSAVDKERLDRSQEFETLLQNVQGMVSKR